MRRRRPVATPYVRVVMHSLAFGSLVPFLTEDPKGGVDRKKMEMTQDVMANSLVYWVQDLWRGGFLGQGSKIYAMTSEGSTRVVPSYGVVSSAKAALESHVRQLAMELARHGTGATANCIRAGVTVTPALLKIPESQTMIDITMKRNPTGRMTTPQDVANAILALSGDGHRVHQRRHHQRRRRRVHHGLVGRAVSGRVIVVGSINVDLVVTVERLPGPGETVHRRAATPGTTAARGQPGRRGGAPRGADRAFIGAIGEDAFGADARATLDAEGVDVTGVVTLAGTSRPGSRSSWSTPPARTGSRWPAARTCALTSVQVRAALKRLALTAGDVVLVGHEIRDRRHARGAAPGQDRRGDDDPQSGPGHRSRPSDARPGRHPHPERGRAGGPRRTRGLAIWRWTEAARAPSPGTAPRWSASVVAGRCSSPAVVRARSTPHASTPSTRSAPAMRSTARWRPGWPAGLDLAEAARRSVVAASLAVTRAGAREGMPTTGELDVALARGTRQPSVLWSGRCRRA